MIDGWIIQSSLFSIPLKPAVAQKVKPSSTGQNVGGSVLNIAVYTQCWWYWTLNCPQRLGHQCASEWLLLLCMALSTTSECAFEWVMPTWALNQFEWSVRPGKGYINAVHHKLICGKKNQYVDFEKYRKTLSFLQSLWCHTSCFALAVVFKRLNISNLYVIQWRRGVMFQVHYIITYLLSPYRFLEEALKFLFIEPPITENNGSTSFYPAANQPFALLFFWQSGWTLCGEVLEGGAGGRLH